MRKLLVPVMLFLSFSCAMTQSTRDSVNAKGKALAIDQFSFEENCPKEKVKAQVLSSGIGASGCGKRKTYMITCPGNIFYVSSDSCYIQK